MLRGRGSGADVDTDDFGDAFMNNNDEPDNQGTRAQHPLTRSNSVGHRAAQSSPAFQVRANNFVRKLGFGILSSRLGIRSKPISTTDEIKDRDPYRASRSLDLNMLSNSTRKPYMSSPVLAVQSYLDSGDATTIYSMDGGASGSGSPSREGHIVVDGEHLDQILKRVKTLPSATQHALGDASKSPATASTPYAGAKLQSHDDVSTSLHKGSHTTSNKPVANASTRAVNNPTIPGKTGIRPSAPRLNTLPPRPGLGDTFERARLSPSVIVRAPPFPIFSLPPTSPSSPSGAATVGPGNAQRSFTMNVSTPSGLPGPSASTLPTPRRPRVRLNTMPHLPRHGQDVRHNGEESDPEVETFLEDEEEDEAETEVDERRTGARTPGSEDDDEDDDEINAMNRTPKAKGKAPRRPFATPRMPSISALVPSIAIPGLPRSNSLGLSSILAAAGVGKTPGATSAGGTLDVADDLSAAATPKVILSNSDQPGLGTASGPALTLRVSHLSPNSSATRDGSHVAAVANSGADEYETPSAISSTSTAGSTLSSLSTTPRASSGLQEASSNLTSASTSASAPKKDYFSLPVPGASTPTFTPPSGSSSLFENDHDSASESTEDGKTGASSPRTPKAKDYQHVRSRKNPQKQAVFDSQAETPGPSTYTSSVADPQASTTPTSVNSSWSIIESGLRLSPPSPRPGLYHQASRSMVDLLSMRTPMEGATTDKSQLDIYRSSRGVDVGGKVDSVGIGMGKEADPDAHAHADVAAASPRDASKTRGGMQEKYLFTAAGPTSPSSSGPQADLSSAMPTQGSLRRRRSMPTFTSSGPPPPYPSFIHDNASAFPRVFAPAPRDDEGCETLPPYTNDIKLIAVMPRKMEFGAPGVPAKDRKWRRAQVVLEGTVLKVYDCTSKVSGVSAIGGWWERKVGVGDIAPQTPNGVAGGMAQNGVLLVAGRRQRRPMKWEEELQAEEERRASIDSASGVTSADDHTDAPMSATEDNDGRPDPQQRKSKRHKIANAFLHPHLSRSHISLSPPNNSPATETSTPHNPHHDHLFGNSRNRSVSPAPPHTRSRSNGNSPLASPRSSIQLGRNGADSSRTSSLDLTSARTSRTSVAGASPSASASTSSFTGHSPSNSVSSHSRSNHRSHDEASSPAGSTDSHSQHLALPEPNPKNLLREYTLQHAESGLASDYFKRKNVLRVRMEGEQFLLQAADVAGVIEWIEGLQAAANIALDLDERPMPKGPIFPRRRRRRRVVVAVAPTEGGDHANAAAAPDAVPTAS